MTVVKPLDLCAHPSELTANSIDQVPRTSIRTPRIFQHAARPQRAGRLPLAISSVISSGLAIAIGYR